MGSVTGVSAKLRSSNLELLRCLSMLMIMILHYLNPNMGGALSGVAAGSFNRYLVYAAESLCIAGPSCFVLISSYFLVTRETGSLRRVVDIYLQMAFYGVAFYLMMKLAFPQNLAGGMSLRRALLPFLSGDRWFIEAYLILYLLSPFISRALRAISKRGYQLLLILLLCLFTGWYSLLPNAPLPGGYSFLNFVILFCLAGYLRLHCDLSHARFLPMAAIWVLCSAVCAVLAAKGIRRAWDYAFLPNMIGAAALFLAFFSLKLPAARLINQLGRRTLGVFFIHADPSMPHFLYRTLLRTQLFWNSPWLLLHCAACVLGLFFLAAGIDWLRALLFTYTLDPILNRVRIFNLTLDPEK